jgi:magnesium/cobalt transport protein CorA
MDLILREISTSGISPVPFSGSLDDLNTDKRYWLEVKTNNREAICELLHSHGFDKRILEQASDPSQSTRINLFSNALIANLSISSTEDIYQAEYFTTIFRLNLLITIVNTNNSTLINIEDEIRNNPFDFDLNLHHVLYYIVAEILHLGMDNAALARKRVTALAKQMDESAESIPLNDIIICKREVGQLTNIVEDQYHMLGFIPKLNWTKEAAEVRKELIELIKGFDYLQNLLERLEEKLSELHAQYQLVLQEKGNKRLNTLTIIQAIFVPLTLISGIYGMNFVLMPELSWRYGYFTVLSVMLVVMIFELWWFRKKGWFK